MITVLWLALFIAGMAIAGPLETFEQVLLSFTKVG
jgi:hypothetical protein